MQLLFEEMNSVPEPEFVTSYKQVLEKTEHIDPVRYAKTRNFINGAVTYLSPYISRGVISVKQVQQIVLQKGYKPYQVEKFLQELAWREYFQRVWQAKKDTIWQDLKQAQAGVKQHAMVTAIQHAATGINSIDEQINKLYASGYMHNHSRMYVAAIACNMAKVHWLQPAKWMYFHLLDGDIASNNCSWQWVAGAFASRKYYCNQENINRYTNSDQRHTFLDKPYEEIAGMPVPEILKATRPLSLQTQLPPTPLPVIDITKPTLIYNGYSLDPLWRAGEDVNRILLLEPSHFKQNPVSEKVISFITDLAKNIPGIQVCCCEISELATFYNGNSTEQEQAFISKEHPAFAHYPGVKDSRDWMFPEVTGYFPSFFSYWKKCERYLP